MTTKEFCNLTQGIKNSLLAEMTGRKEATICFYKTGRRQVPSDVAAVVQELRRVIDEIKTRIYIKK